MYWADSDVRPLLFSAHDRPSHHVVRKHVNVVASHLDHAFGHAIERFMGEVGSTFVLAIMLEAGGLKWCTEAVSAFKRALEQRRCDLSTCRNLVLPTILAIVALGEDNVAAVNGKAFTPPAHAFVEFGEPLIGKLFNANAVFDTGHIDLPT